MNNARLAICDYHSSISFVLGCFIVDTGKANLEIIVYIVILYEAWVYLAYILLPIAYFIVFCYVRCTKMMVSSSLSNGSLKGLLQRSVHLQTL